MNNMLFIGSFCITSVMSVDPLAKFWQFIKNFAQFAGQEKASSAPHNTTLKLRVGEIKPKTFKRNTLQDFKPTSLGKSEWVNITTLNNKRRYP
jgi:hypothetical protein